MEGRGRGRARGGSPERRGSFRGGRGDTRGGSGGFLERGGPSRGGRGESPNRGGRGDSPGGGRGFSERRASSRGGRGDFRGDFRGGRGSFRGGRGDPSTFENPGDMADPIFESRNVPAPDQAVTQWENKLAGDVASGMESLSIAGTKSLPVRPSYGTQGNPIVVRANFFPLNIVEEDLTLHRYELAILPRSGVGDAEDDATKKMAKARRRQFIAILMTHPMFREVRCATDYAKTIITDQKLNMTELGSATVEVPFYDPEEHPLPPQTPGEPAALTERRRNRTRKIRISPSGELGNLSVKDLLQAVASGRQTDYYIGKEEMIQALNIVLNSAVLSTPQNPRVSLIGNNKFYPFVPGDLTKSFDLYEGLEALRGYFSSLRIGANRMLLNVNIASGAFYKGQPLPDLVYAYAGTDRGSSTMNRLNVFLKGLKVLTRYVTENGQPLIQARKIVSIAARPAHGLEHQAKGKQPVNVQPGQKAALGGNSREVKNKWDNEGKEEYLTVLDYFKKHYGRAIKNPNEFVVNCGTPNNPFYIPIEFCSVVSGQPAQRLLSGNQTSLMIRFAARPPKLNAMSITSDGLQLLKVKDEAAQRATHGSWGIEVKGDMITVNARILKPPTIGFRGKDITARDGMWNFISLTFIKGAVVPSWSILYLRNPSSRNRMEKGDVEQLAESFRRQAASYGITMPKCSAAAAADLPHLSLATRGDTDKILAAQFEALSKDPKPSLVWVIVPSKDIFLKARIKLYGDTRYGIQTMLIQEQTVAKDSPDTMANEAAKLNLRFGGTCWKVDRNTWKPLDETYMLMGIDVTHPSPGSSESAPSVAAVVATIDSDFAQYRGRVRPQGSRVEMVNGLGRLAGELLQLWRKHNGRFPKNILVYRDGVSEGQYQDVLNTEIPALEEAFAQLYGEPENWPNLSFVVVTKRHHVRFFPTNKADASGKMFNCKPGTVVDRGITGGGTQLWDTYLQAHQGIQGHARSARYVILRHGIKAIKVDDFERITNALCYMWQRAPRSVSYAPPAYYADLLAERGRAYLIRYMNDPENRVHYNASNAEWTGDVHEQIRDTMYFC